jgi:hypothetical protein
MKSPEDSSVFHGHLHGLPLTEQLRFAREGNQQERIVVERLYGKTVWETLLKNSRLSIQEVVRIARMGSLPRPLIELIVSNPSWIANAQLRRGLLTNPRLGREQVVKVLRAMPRAELKLVPRQSIYGSTVREAARKLF